MEPDITERIKLSKKISSSYLKETILAIMARVVSFPPNQREEEARRILSIIEKCNSEDDAVRILRL